MSDKVIIEFIGDTSKLEEAYNKMEEQLSTASNLNRENAAQRLFRLMQTANNMP